jgi:hypothetical protein
VSDAQRLTACLITLRVCLTYVALSSMFQAGISYGGFVAYRMAFNYPNRSVPFHLTTIRIHTMGEFAYLWHLSLHGLLLHLRLTIGPLLSNSRWNVDFDFGVSQQVSWACKPSSKSHLLILLARFCVVCKAFACILLQVCLVSSSPPCQSYCIRNACHHNALLA